MIYDDGEEDAEICRTCIRPFVPYQVGDKADWTDLSEFYPCEIIAVHGEDSYEVRLTDSDRVVSNVSASQLRRGSNKKLVLQVGSRVRAQFPGEPANQLFPGTIHADLGNGYYSIVYDDGDYAPQVAKSMIYPPL